MRPLFPSFVLVLSAVSALCQANVQMSWPVIPDDRSTLGQVFGERNIFGNERYHTGIDIVGVNMDVHAAFSGTVVFVQELDTHGCSHASCPITTPGSGTGTCSDHGFGNTVIVKHQLASETVYTQYSHLSSISPHLLSACSTPSNYRQSCNVAVTTADSLGKSGGSGYGALSCWQPHLHFEVKSVPSLASISNDAGDFGYSATPPDPKIYKDPIVYIHTVVPFSEKLSAASDTTAYRGPGGSSSSSYGSVERIHQGQQFIALASSTGLTKPLCTRWLEVASTDATYLADTTHNPGVVPNAWICQDQVQLVNTPPVGYLDFAGDSITGKSQISTGLLVRGWAADHEDGSPVARVEIQVDGKVVGTASLGILRNDVAATYAKEQNWSKSGWAFTTNVNVVAYGSHVIIARAYDKQGAVTTLGQQTVKR